MRLLPSTAPAALLLVALAGCSDQPAAPAIAPAQPPALAALTCRVDVRRGSLSCTDAVASAGNGNLLIVGGQGHYVRLTSTGIAYDAATDLFSSTVTVQNLLQQALGTTDGVTADAAGVRVFFSSGPTTTAGTGTVVVANADGTGTFTAPGQPYFQYAGPLAPDSTSEGKVWRFKVNGAASFSFTVYVAAQVPGSDPAANYLHLREIAAGANAGYSCGLASGGQAYCWGLNGFGQLGDNTVTQRRSPVAVHQPAGVRFASLSAGSSHTCGLTSAGQAYCWGYDGQGQVGDDGSGVNRLTPVAVQQPAGVTFASVHVGDAHGCGLTAGGQAYCWGRNNDGEVGDGTSGTSRLRPVAVQQPAGVTFASLSAGGSHNCGLTSAGQAYCWGRNDSGQLGDSTRRQRNAPVAVQQPEGVTFTALTAGGYHTCGLTSAGQAYCWGSNGFGGLGDGTSGTDRLTPVAVQQPAGVAFASLRAGGFHTCGLTSAGQAYCWGYNTFGGLGDETTTQRNAPVPVHQPSGVTFISVAPSGYHTCGASTAGPAYCWGSNADGQLGDGTLVSHPAPVFVAGTR